MNDQFESVVNDIIVGGDYKIEREILASILDTKTSTNKDTKPLEKRFPAVLWSNRHGTNYYQFAMSEYLASYGYIVFCLSRSKPILPLPWMVDSSQRSKLFMQYEGDMNALIREVKKFTNVDTSSMAVFSWSYGGESAIFAQQSHPEIDIVFGFSSINFSKPYFIPDFNKKIIPIKLNVPYYLFYEDTVRFGSKVTTEVLHPSHFEKSKLIQYPALIHGNFNYIEGYIPSLFNLPASHRWANRGKEVMLGYESMCRLTELFLRSYFHNKNNDYVDGEIKKIRSSIPVKFLETKK